jgi:predicted transcriptional regulator
MKMNFENFINEKLGIREDVIILSDFLFEYLKEIHKGKIVIDGKDIPKVSFKISKIFIEFIDEHNYLGSFDEKRTKLTNDGIEVYLIFNNKNNDLLKSTISHELSHLIDHEIKLSKNINSFKDEISASKISNYLNNKKFENLCNMIYLSDDSEIKSMTHEFYEFLIKEYTKYKNIINKNVLFNMIVYSSTVNCYNDMINYNIFEDLKDIPEKSKLKFFNDLINWNKKIINIKKNKNNKLTIIIKILYYIIRGYEKNIDLYDIMYKTQKHINMKGIKLRNKIHKIYGLLEN